MKMGELVSSITAEPGLTRLTQPRISGKQSWNIAVLPGDGVGPEVIAEGVRALKAVENCLNGVQFELVETSAGAAEFLRSGEALPAPALETCRTADATLLGSMGLPNVRWPDGRELTPQLDLREKLDLYCGLRPARLYHANDTPLKQFEAGQIDFVIVRENTEGLFSARQAKGNGSAAEACDTLRITRRGAERLFRSAFQIARGRRRKVTLVDKANVLPSMVFFRRVFDGIAGEFPDVETERIYVDAAALYLLRYPDRFDVLVTENMFGDILSDLSASLVGGMGMAPAADIGDQHAVFQAAHGSAPDIAGKGIANPVAAILTVALMLDWLNTLEARKGAAMIRGAVETVLADPANRTPDVGGRLTTRQMGDLIVSHI